MRLTTEHHPARADERARIETHGGWVSEEREMLLSRLHRADLHDPAIRRYAEKMIGYQEISRVNSELSVSRSFGDFDYKMPGVNEYCWLYPRDSLQERLAREGAVLFTDDLVLVEPDWRQQSVSAEDEFVLIACDGVWEGARGGAFVPVSCSLSIRCHMYVCM